MPTLVNSLNSAAMQFDARISPSGLELYLTREDPVRFKQIHRYTRPNLQADWGNDILQTALTVQSGSESASADMTFANDTKAYLSVFQGGLWNIFTTTRLGAGAAWSPPAMLAGISAVAKTDEMPWLSAARDKLYFVSDRGLNGLHIFVSSAIGTNFQTPVQLNLDIANTFSQYSPVTSTDGKTLYFAGSIQGNRYIYRSTLNGAAFTNSAREPNISPGATNQLTWLSPDGCEAYLTIDGKIYKTRKP
jgi:Tol biopolymer transport system component